jgi:ribosomal protein L35
MPKLKTHKGTKKVINVRPGGTISTKKPGKNHKSSTFTRSSRNDNKLSKSDLKRIKGLI